MNITNINFAIDMLSHPQSGDESDINMALDIAIESLKVWREALEKELKTGHWIDTGSGQECSECGEIQYGYDSHRFYCPNCGAKMESEVKNE